VHALRPVGNLPHPEAEQRDLVAVGEHTGATVCREYGARHPTSLRDRRRGPGVLVLGATGRWAAPAVPHRHLHGLGEVKGAAPGAMLDLGAAAETVREEEGRG